MSMESQIIQNPFYHYTYVFDKNTGNLEYPDVYLLSKGLHKLGQLYPVNELNIVVKANDTDEVSFTFQKYINDTEQELYDKVKTDSVVYVKGFGCFQLKVNENDKGEGVYKNVSGESLADVELSNILATLEINTEQDILVSDYENENVTDYIPTVFFRDESKYDDYAWSTRNSKLSDNEKKQKLKDSSLLHRIFSYAPHYEIGHVDESLYYVQRDFSWSNSYIKDILNDVAEEVGCIFTFETYLDDEGKTVRKVNAYDISYCEKCFQDAAMQLSYKTFDVSKFRSITNGICDNCGSSKYVYDYGKDTDIFITTENLTDEISVQPENEIKNVFKISGGDDNITRAIQSLNMGSSKIMMFSEETKNEMSDELRKKFEDYINDQSSIAISYETLVETQSNVCDLIQYLQSGKMPQLSDNARDIQEEVKYLLNSITEDYENNFYVESYDKGEKSFLGHEQTVSSSSIKNLFTLYLDKGYSVRVSNGDIGDKTNSNDSYVRWDGIITVYETSNSDNYADIHCFKSDSTYVVYNQITEQNSDNKLQETYDSFYVNLMFVDQDSVKYASYIQQFCEQKLASYKKVEYKNEEEKPWNEYCYERLKSFYDGYQACLELLSEMDSQQTIQSIKQVISDLYTNYSFIQYKISQQMKILVQQINALYRYLGEYTYDTDKYGKRTYSPDYVSEDYVVDYKNALSYLANPSMIKYFIGTKPIACKKCGSSNVGIAKNKSGEEYNYCLSCGNTDSSLLVTYADIAKQVSEQCNRSESNLLKDITEIRNKFKIENYFGELYSELLPYIKEQEYSNSNYTSDACNTNQDIIAKAKELLQKARKELYKACEQQYSVSANVFSIVAERWENWDVNTKYHDMYDKFSLGNWMRVRLDKAIKKLRLISITFDFDAVDKMSVEFSDVIQVGNVLSDINSVLQQASSISSTYNYVTDQAKQGSEANVEINKILQNGLDSAYSAVMAGDNQEITMDRHGLLFRKFLDELDDYSKYQMKLINRNIVMTDDGWDSARLAIGLGMLPDGTYGYGIWADNIIGGNITCTNNLRIVGGESSVIIDGDGIRFGEGVIDSSAINGLDDSLESFVDSIGNLQNQIDGKSNCTYGGSTPPSNPETGDLWFCTDNSSGYGANKAYMYNGSSWVESNGVPDSVWDIADGKSSIFVVKPENPISELDNYCYHKNDIWILESDMTLNGESYKKGSIMTSTSDSTEFDQTNWIEKIRYTDDTKANSVYDALSDFQTDVTNCFGTKITKDAVISPKIGGGYLHIKDIRETNNTGTSVEINPSGTNFGSEHNADYVFSIAKDNDIVMGVTNDGDGYFSGEIVTDSGNIGGWIIEEGSLKTKTNAAIYQLNSDVNGSPCMRIMNGKAIFGLYGTKIYGYFDDSQYIDISNKGIYAKNKLTADALYSLEYDNSANKFNVNCDEFNVNSLTYFNDLTYFHDTATFYYMPYFRKGLRIYDDNSSSNYINLTVSAYDSSASNSYLVNNGSMKIAHRLQIGDNYSGYDTSNTLRVVGSSYVTGTSYTNSGVTVTSDRNKKNSISTPTDNYVQLFDAISFRRFKYNDGTSNRFHLGVIAQELEEAMKRVCISSEDFGGLVIDEQGNYYVRYDEINILTALKVKQLEESRKEVEEQLEKRISILEERISALEEQMQKQT